MAQVLKEEQRIKILQASKKELLAQGYRNSSMREIAKDAGMTVGNLYRYFKNKDELFQYIVAPTLDEINKIVSNETNNQIHVFQTNMPFTMSIEDIQERIVRISTSLIHLLDDHYEEMMILMEYANLRYQIIDWFKDLVREMVYYWRKPNQEDKAMVDTLCDMFTISLCYGLEKLFQEYPNIKDKCSTNQIIQIYLGSYIKLFSLEKESSRGTL